MSTWIILLRALNVGGTGKLSMKELRSLLMDLGYTNVQTYIQSGNGVLQATQTNPLKIQSAIEDAIDQKMGFRPKVLALSIDDLRGMLDTNPYNVSADDGSKVHFFVLGSAPPSPDLDAIEMLKTTSESYSLTDQVFYLHAPDGIGRSKLAEQAERKLGVPATARNLRTMRKLLEMAESADS